MLSPSLSLLVAIAAILVLLVFRRHPGYAIFAGSLVLSFLVISLRDIPSLLWQTLLDVPTVRLLIVVICTQTMSSIMESKGLLSRLAGTMEGLGSKLSLHLVPALIGLVPMPAGALVSATSVRDLTKRLDLNPEQSTFINYWFRHIWEFSVPVYPAIIITAATLSISLFSVVQVLFPLTLVMVALGATTSYFILRKSPGTRAHPARSMALDLVKAAWPILLLVVLIMAKVEAMIAFPATLLLLLIVQRPGRPELKKGFKYGLNPRVLLLLYSVMLFKAAIDTSGAASVAVQDMQAIGLPAVLMLALLPLVMGLATGYSPGFAGVALPLLVPFIASGTGIDGAALLLAYGSGMLGVLLSPVHLCLVLSADYFKASLGKVFKYVLPLCVVIEVVVVLVFLLAGH